MGTKFNDDRVARIVQAFEAGAAGMHAAMAGGISYATLGNWLAEGQLARDKEEAGEELSEDETAKMMFLDRVDNAKSGVVTTLMRIISDAAPTNWQAAAWKLERLYPQLYGRTVQTVGGDPEAPIVHKHSMDLSGLSYEQLLEIADALRNR